MANPLLDFQFQIPFDQVRAEHVEPAVDELLSRALAKLDELTGQEGERTFANTLAVYDTFTEPLDYAMNIVRHLEGVATTPELRAAHNATQPKVAAFYSALPLNEGLWRAVRSYAETAEGRSLTGAKARFLSKTLDFFKRHGAELDAAGKVRLQEIDVELAQLTTKFSENVLDSTNAFEIVLTDESRLAGLPPSAVAAARQSAELKGREGWRFTLHGPSYLAVMTYLEDAEIRRQMYLAYSRRASEGEWDNRRNIIRILALRREKARLLGYTDFADFVTEERMAKNGAHAQSFLDDLAAKTAPRFETENQELRAFRGDGPLEAWDVSFWAEKQRQALYAFDEEELRPYFPLDRVVEGMFDIFSRVFGIRVREVSGVPVWDAAVRCFAIEFEDGTPAGSFYTDWFPRENKRGGAWMDVLITGVPSVDPGRRHLGLICGNLTPPIGDRPALLTHREVETIFHEFGHLLHHCLSRVEVRSLAGTNVAWDFVELPSQIMENWCWERESLDLFARHFETGEPIPEELFQKMVRARNFRAANAQMRQLGFAVTDLKLHREFDPDGGADVIEYSRSLLGRFSPVPLPDGHAMLASFSHLFASPVAYGAGYYSYKWAEVLDADAFTRFRSEGIFNSATGREYRDRILARGDSADPAELYRSFMSRDPDPEALLRRAGLVG